MKKVLALIAHDSRKDDIIQLIKAHKEELAEIEMIATLDTGQRIRERTGRPVTLLLSGPLGGGLVEKLSFLRPGVPASFSKAGRLEPAQLAGLSPDAKGQIRSNEAE